MSIQEQIEQAERLGLAEIAATLRLYQSELMGTKGESHAFNECMSAYFSFYAQHTGGLLPCITAAQGKALKAIIKHLRVNSYSKDDQGAIDSFQYITQNWRRLSKFMQQQTQLTSIFKHLDEILTQLKTGHHDRTAAKELESEARANADKSLSDIIASRTGKGV